MKIISSNTSKVNEIDDNSGKNTLESFSSKDAKWTEKKRGATVVQNHYSEKTRFEKLASRMNDCAKFLNYDEVVFKETGELSIKLAYAQFCHVRNCEVCMWRRSMRNVAKFISRLPPIFEKYPKPAHEWIFLTLTVPNCKSENLRETIDAMQKAFDRLKMREEFKGAFIGYVKTVEVTKEEKRNGYAHPHFHILLLTSKWYFKSKDYIKQDRMLELWQESMRDKSITQVDMRKVKPKKGQDLFGAVVETLKYGVKPADIKNDKEFLYSITDQLHKLRFVDSGGVLKGILKDEKNLTNQDLINTGHPEEKEEKEIEKTGRRLMFIFSNKRHRFLLHETRKVDLEKEAELKMQGIERASKSKENKEQIYNRIMERRKAK